MAREATVWFGIVIPDYVTDADVYHAADKAGEVLEENHISATNMMIQGLVEDLVEEPEELAQLRDEAHDENQ